MEACSIYELSATVLKLCEKLYKFFKALRDVPEEINEYLGALESTRVILADTQKYCELHQQSHFRTQDGMKLEVLYVTLKTCEIDFSYQLSLVESVDLRTASSWFSNLKHRTTWVFSKELIELSTSKLEKAQDRLHLAISASSGSVLYPF
jgi:hypothetical protein